MIHDFIGYAAHKCPLLHTRMIADEKVGKFDPNWLKYGEELMRYLSKLRGKTVKGGEVVTHTLDEIEDKLAADQIARRTQQLREDLRNG